MNALPIAWMTPSDWREEPLATACKSVASAWRADNRQVTPLYASQPKALTVYQKDALWVAIELLNKADRPVDAAELRALLESTK